jgi:hypothetical protein
MRPATRKILPSLQTLRQPSLASERPTTLFLLVRGSCKGFDWTADQADHSLRILSERYWEVVTKDDATRYWAIKP